MALAFDLAPSSFTVDACDGACLVPVMADLGADPGAS